MDIGESLVAAYFRHVRKCHTIAFNQFLPDKQGEIDVIGLADADGPSVWLAEVAIHLDDLKYGSYDQTVAKVAKKMETARTYAQEVFTERRATIEFWSPRVPMGLVARLDGMADVLVINDLFTSRVNELAGLASKATKQYGDEAFRFLQLLTHLRGDRPTFRI